MSTLYWVLGIVLLFTAIVRWDPLRLGRRNKPGPDQEESVPLQSVTGFIPDCDDSQSEFVHYICAWAKQQQIKKSSLEDLQNVFASQFESLQLSYVFQTNETLVLNDVNDTIAIAAQKYLDEY